MYGLINPVDYGANATMFQFSTYDPRHDIADCQKRSIVLRPCTNQFSRSWVFSPYNFHSKFSCSIRTILAINVFKTGTKSVMLSIFIKAQGLLLCHLRPLSGCQRPSDTRWFTLSPGYARSSLRRGECR
ncbi:hypothetical protein Sjap_013634 [Stephania japonica]|uniref:Uncharacterized protein n=1 Tax=Stephania japonica TaxID=461633 RepID=A0AAP0IY59_9MAGN